MKAIISHDIDHLTVTEHLLKDIIVPKHMVRMHIELALGKISVKEYVLRWSELFKNKWQNIDELITYNNIKHVPSSFFVGVRNGIGLSYTNEAALVWINQMRSRDCEVGVHGINFDDIAEVKEELEVFLKLSGQQKTGVRMHYVRRCEDTLMSLSKAGYVYDSTIFSFENPYKVGNMWEFPFQIMDGWILEEGKRWQHNSFIKAKDKTKKMIDKAYDNDLLYLGVDFHDRYFNNSFKTWIDWYMWVIDYLSENKIEFVNFTQAVEELEMKATESWRQYA